MGKLSIVATPIGNLEDITIRAIKTLFSADVILCEDTRRSGQLLHGLIAQYGEQFDMVEEASPKLVSYYDEIEDRRLPEVIQLLEQDKHVALISDAGTPLVSDPGFRLVREALKRRITVESIPGASAILTALTSSGLPSDKFTFLGYPPEKEAHRRRLFENVRQSAKLITMTYVLYCAPHKLRQTLIEMQESLGDIDMTVARELTKVHEQVWRGSISDAITTPEIAKGELVLLFTL